MYTRRSTKCELETRERYFKTLMARPIDSVPSNVRHSIPKKRYSPEEKAIQRTRTRYVKTAKRYEKQFQREIQLLLDNQPRGYEAALLTRHLCISTLWPPYHNQVESKATRDHFYKLPKKDEVRLNQLMDWRGRYNEIH